MLSILLSLNFLNYSIGYSLKTDSIPVTLSVIFVLNVSVGPVISKDNENSVLFFLPQLTFS